MPSRFDVLRARGSRRKTEPQSIAAPLKGWNTRDPFEAMDPLDAVLLDNWYPDFQGLLARAGSQNYVTGLGGGVQPVQTVSAYRTGTQNRFLAASNGSIFDITNPASPITLGTNFGSDIWQVVTFNGHQFWANGSDPVQIFDGTTLAPATFTGVSLTTLVGVGVFNNRLYFWTTSDTGFWYGPVDGITGALSFFDFSMVTLDGGNLMAVDVLSYDGGTGIDDYTLFFLTSGEVLMYSGTDPSNPNNWALVGRYKMPPPLGMRTVARYGGDLYITTANDHQQFSKFLIALKLGETPPRTKASGAVAAAYQSGQELSGWQAIYYPTGARILYNIPNPDGTFSQHVYNTATSAFCRYRGLQAYCWGLYNGNLYFGGPNGSVVQAEIGTADNGATILSSAQQAWQTLDTPLIKRIALVRPVVQSLGMAIFSFSLGFDYQLPTMTSPGATLPTGNSLVFGSSKWGAPTTWGGVGATDPRWLISGGEGAAISPALVANTELGAIWIRTDAMIEPGSSL